jgi:hypothetical protein
MKFFLVINGEFKNPSFENKDKLLNSDSAFGDLYNFKFLNL